MFIYRAADASSSPDTSDRQITGGIAAPPSSGRTSRPRPGRQSPAQPVASGGTFERPESVGSLERVPPFGTTAYNPSRGPSPLTIGMSDSIPVAVAFSETINALFKGADFNK